MTWVIAISVHSVEISLHREISNLAKEGMRFSDFHVQPTCSPTRSSLLTGNDNHVAGMGIMSEMDYPELQALNLPGYSGNLSKQVVTIPEVLRDNGYHTYMTGKWHLGEGPGRDPFDRGFEQTFILGTGGGSHWYDKKPLSPLQKMEYTRNGKLVNLPIDFYSTRNYTDSLISFIDKNKTDKKPFFAYLSYTACTILFKLRKNISKNIRVNLIWAGIHLE